MIGRRRTRRRVSGVTLLEILVAVAVLAIGLATVFQIFPMGFAASNQSRAKAIAYELAAQKLEDIRNEALFGGPSTSLGDYWGEPLAPNPDGGTVLTEVNTSTSTLRNFRQFPAGSSTITAPQTNYFYAVECKPVIDPTQKFVREAVFTRPNGVTNLSEGFTSMWRITVTVRGPLASVAEAQDAMWSQNALLQKGAVEAQLATYIANKSLGEAYLAYDQYQTATENPIVANQVYESNYYLFIRNNNATSVYPSPENFTVFERSFLHDRERYDTGPTDMGDASEGEDTALPDPDTTNQQLGLNYLGMDNVVIFYQVGTSPARYVAESNKVVGIMAPSGFGGVTNDNPSTDYWCLVLMNPLGFNDTDFPTRTSTYGASSLMDAVYNGVPRPGGGSTPIYYPAWTSGTNGTRVRFLINLDRTSSS